MIFGASWNRIGPDGEIWNHHVVPVMIDIPNSLDEALKLSRVNPVKRRIKMKALEFFLRGLPDEAVLPVHRERLAATASRRWPGRKWPRSDSRGPGELSAGRRGRRACRGR